MDAIKEICKKVSTCNGRVSDDLKNDLLLITKSMSAYEISTLTGVNRSTIIRWKNQVKTRCESATSLQIVENQNATDLQRICNSTTEEKLEECEKALQLKCNESATENKEKCNEFFTLQKRCISWAQIVFSAVILCASTYLLIDGSIGFYKQESSGLTPLIKSLIIELSIVYLSFVKFKPLFKILALMILVAYSCYSVSGLLVDSTIKSGEKLQLITKEIDSLSRELAEKNRSLAAFIDRDRLTYAARTEQQKSEIVNKLSTLLTTKRLLSSQKISDENTAALVIYRIILLFLNIFFGHHLRGLVFNKQVC